MVLTLLARSRLRFFYNNTEVRWAFYENADYTGKRFTLEAGETAEDLFGTGFNDQISSYRSEPEGIMEPLMM
jgi:hypothetical protein